MFEKKEENNPFITRMEGYQKRALERSSRDIAPLIREFFNESINRQSDWKGNNASNWNWERTTEAAVYLADNTTEGETLNQEDLACINGVFQELRNLRNEVEGKTDENQYYRDKVSCISEILCKNMIGRYRKDDDQEINYRQGLIFGDLKNLYAVINLINTKYDELVQSGFSLKTFYDFWDITKADRYSGTEKSEVEKMNLFLGLLNGTMKFHPQYEYKAVGYQVVPKDFNETLVRRPESKYDQGYIVAAKTNQDTFTDDAPKTM